MASVKKVNSTQTLGVTKDNTRAVNIQLFPEFKLVTISPVVQAQAAAGGGDSRWPKMTAQNLSSFWGPSI